MKILSVLLAACLCGMASAQAPLSPNAALKQLYGNYDAVARTTTLPCTDAQRIENSKDHGSWWPCYKNDSVVSVQVVLMAEVALWTDPEHNIKKATYLVTSAVPAHDPLGFNCHSCEPAIGVAQFAWKDGEWKLEAANATVGFYGSWGAPPFIDLVAIGPSHYGIMASMDFGGQGYMVGSKWLLAPVGKTVSEVWKIQDEQDDFGAYDPKGIDAPSTRFRSAAGIRFSCSLDGSCANGNGYFDIEVISRGSDETGPKLAIKSQNWTNVYRFKDGKFRLIRHEQFIEVKRSANRKR